MRRPWESLQVAFLFYNILKTVFYKSKTSKSSDRNSLYTDVVLFGERGARARKKKTLFYFSFLCFRNRFLSRALDGL